MREEKNHDPLAFEEVIVLLSFITSTDVLRQTETTWNPRYVVGLPSKKICEWSWEYYREFQKAPDMHIFDICDSKLFDKKITEAEYVNIKEALNKLIEDTDNRIVNTDYLLSQTKKYINKQKVTLHSTEISKLIAQGKVEDAERLISEYKPDIDSSDTDLDLNHPVALKSVEKAFNTTSQSVLTFPGQLGAFINSQLTQGSLVAFLAPEKRGKTWFLLEIAMRASKQGRSVAFFSAGDMTQDQIMMRMCIYLTRKSNREEYSGKMWEPVRDCLLNQTHQCQRSDRMCDFGIFPERDEKELRKEIQKEELIEAYETYPDYKPCYNCKDYDRLHLGATWLVPVDTGDPLTVKEAQDAWEDFFIKHNRKFKLSCHPNDTLTVPQIEARCEAWKKEDGFIPDLIIIDYADILTTEKEMEERPKQNKIWKGLRRLSQNKKYGMPLVVTATQADSDSYDKFKLKMKNFSEDKRKFGHATCFLSLNQDPNGREKKLGILRIGILALREGDYNTQDEVTVLQNLRRGRPFISSYF